MLQCALFAVLFVASMAVPDTTANVTAATEPFDGMKAFWGKRNCIIKNKIGLTFKRLVPQRISECDEQWVLSFSNYPRFERGSQVFARQWEYRPPASAMGPQQTTTTTTTTTSNNNAAGGAATPPAGGASNNMNNNNMVTEKRQTQDNQKWFFSKTGQIITEGLKNRYALDVEGGNKNPGARVRMWAKHNGDNQQFWADKPDSDGYFYIKSKMEDTDLALEIVADDKGAPLFVRTHTPVGGDYQKWKIVCEEEHHPLPCREELPPTTTTTSTPPSN